MIPFITKIKLQLINQVQLYMKYLDTYDSNSWQAAS